MPLLEGRVDAFNGIIIDSDALPTSTADFASSLAHSLEVWSTDKLQAVSDSPASKRQSMTCGTADLAVREAARDLAQSKASFCRTAAACHTVRY